MRPLIKIYVQSFVDSFSAGLYKEYTSKGLVVQVSLLQCSYTAYYNLCSIYFLHFSACHLSL